MITAVVMALWPSGDRVLVTEDGWEAKDATVAQNLNETYPVTDDTATLGYEPDPVGAAARRMATTTGALIVQVVETQDREDVVS